MNLLLVIIISFEKVCVCYGCHDFLQRAMDFVEVSIVTVQENVFRIHFKI